MKPFPLKNETTVSYYSRVAHLNNGMKFVKTSIFNKSKSNPTHPLFGGFDALNCFLSPKDATKFNTFQDNSFFPYLRPFMLKEQYDLIFRYTHRHVLCAKKYIPSTLMTSLRIEPAVCQSCLQEDFETLGYSYLRRQHQIACNLLCEIHNEFLISKCPRCGAPLVINGMPVKRCNSCKHTLQANAHSENIRNTQRMALTRISEAVSDIFSRRIAGNLNLNIYLDSTIEETRAQRIIKLGIAKKILNIYGESYLYMLKLHPSRKPNFGWPGIYCNGKWQMINPTMELLLYGANEVTSNETSLWSQSPLSTGRQKSVFDNTANFDFSSLKSIFKHHDQHQAAAASGITVTSIRRFIYTYPTLRERLSYRRDKMRLEESKSKIREYLDMNPNTTVTDLIKSHEYACTKICSHDPEWWYKATSKIRVRKSRNHKF